MIINLSPVRDDKYISVSVAGDSISINGEQFDFTQLPEGATLPTEAIASNYLTGKVERIDGELHLTLTLPHGNTPPPHIAFPEPIHVTEDGPVKLPTEELENAN